MFLKFCVEWWGHAITLDVYIGTYVSNNGKYTYLFTFLCSLICISFGVCISLHLTVYLEWKEITEKYINTTLLFS